MKMLALISFAAFDPGSSMEGILRWEGTVRWMESVLPLLQDAATLIFCSWVAVLIPMSVFRRAHPTIAKILRVSSVFVGGVCWWHAFIVTYRLMGWLATVIGVLLAGIGVIPMALFAAGVKNDWEIFRDLVAASILTIVPRIIAKFITAREAKIQRPVAVSSYYSGDFHSW